MHSIAGSRRISCRASGWRTWSRCLGASLGATAANGRRSNGAGIVPRRSRRAAAGRAPHRDRPVLCRGKRRGNYRRAGPRGGFRWSRQRMGGRDKCRAARQVADQPQGYAAAADRRARLRPRTGARAGIPADAAFHGRRTISTKACARWLSTRTRTRAGGRRRLPMSVMPRWRAISRRSATGELHIRLRRASLRGA